MSQPSENQIGRGICDATARETADPRLLVDRRPAIETRLGASLGFAMAKRPANKTSAFVSYVTSVVLGCAAREVLPFAR